MSAPQQPGHIPGVMVWALSGVGLEFAVGLGSGESGHVNKVGGGQSTCSHVPALGWAGSGNKGLFPGAASSHPLSFLLTPGRSTRMIGGEWLQSR